MHPTHSPPQHITSGGGQQPLPCPPGGGGLCGAAIFLKKNNHGVLISGFEIKRVQITRHPNHWGSLRLGIASCSGGGSTDRWTLSERNLVSGAQALRTPGALAPTNPKPQCHRTPGTDGLRKGGHTRRADQRARNSSAPANQGPVCCRGCHTRRPVKQ